MGMFGGLLRRVAAAQGQPATGEGERVGSAGGFQAPAIQSARPSGWFGKPAFPPVMRGPPQLSPEELRQLWANRMGPRHLGAPSMPPHGLGMNSETNFAGTMRPQGGLPSPGFNVWKRGKGY